MTAIDSKASTITLRDVNVVGTENRDARKPTEASDKPYDFIVFRISDIKEFCVIRGSESIKSSSDSGSSSEFSDSAIVQKRSSKGKKSKNSRSKQQKKKSNAHNQKKIPALPTEEFLFIDENGKTSHLVGCAVPLNKPSTANPQIIYASDAGVHNQQRQYGRFQRDFDNRRDSYRPQRYDSRNRGYQRRNDPVKEFQREMKQKKYAEKEFEKSQDLTKILHNMVHNGASASTSDEKTKNMRDKIVQQWGTEKVEEEESKRHQYNPDESFFDDISRQKQPEDKKDSKKEKSRRPSYQAPYRPQLKIGPSTSRNYSRFEQPVVIYRNNEVHRQFTREDPRFLTSAQQFYPQNRFRQQQIPPFRQRNQRSNWGRSRSSSFNAQRRPSQTMQKKDLDPISSQLAALTQKKIESVAEEPESQEPKVTADASIEGITSAVGEIQVS